MHFRDCEPTPSTHIFTFATSAQGLSVGGGGAVLDPENASSLRSVANVVWLTASPEVLWGRMHADPKTIDSRPPLTRKTGLDELRQLLADRKRCYEETADLAIETDGKTPHEVAQAIEHILRGSAAS